jgi:TolB-like protein
MSGQLGPAVCRVRAASGHGRLRQGGDLLKLAPQPFKVLELLARRGGEVRDPRRDPRSRLERRHVRGFDQGLNFCIRQIREVLGRHRGRPAIHRNASPPRLSVPDAVTARRRSRRSPVTRLIVLPFRMLRPDSETEFLAFSLPDALTSALGGLQSLVVRSSMTAARFAGDSIAPRQIGVEADVDAIVTGTLLRSGSEIASSTQLTAATTGALLWSQAAQTRRVICFASRTS